MTLTAQSKSHWNYFLALEKDLDASARYVEFSRANLKCFSIEFAHLLFAAASEVDVIAKLLCARLDPAAPHRNIDHYRAVLLAKLPALPASAVHLPRYGLTLRPWKRWGAGKNPLWWRSYNNVKHQRDQHFHEATLKNALNAMGALLLLTYHHYAHVLAPTPDQPLSPKETTRVLEPESGLLRLPDDHYYFNIIG